MKVTINQKAMNRLRQGHPWIFRGDLEEINADHAGPVDVCSGNHKVLGQALFSPKSLISLRMMTRGSEKINKGLIKRRIETANLGRQAMFPGEKCYRLIFGESDGLPSLIIDRYEDCFVFQSLSAGMETFKEDIIEILKDLFKPKAIIERNDVSVREKEGLTQIRQVVWGSGGCPEIATILGKRFHLDLLEGQKTGFFLDQRLNARKVASWTRGKVLDCFSYSGQFAVHASPFADSILCVDQSPEALKLVQSNCELNSCANITTHSDNVFDFLKFQDQEQAQFDTVNLDPPAFVKSRSALINAQRGYKEINLRAMKLLKPGGTLITFSCSQNLSRNEFLWLLQKASLDAHRSVQILEELSQPPDHPRLLTMPESEYLKGFVLRII